jgi:hypothetical protein
MGKGETTMTQIVLTPDQVELYHQAREPVQVCDTEGNVLGTLPPDCSAEFIQEQKRRAASPGPWYSGDDVQAMFRMLDETWSKEGGLDNARLKQLLGEFEAQHGKTV